MPSSKWLALALLAAACSSEARADYVEFSPPVASPTDDGAVRIAQGSLEFIETEAIAKGATGAVVDAPARVAFRDGAIARLASPIAGRVVDIKVQVSQQVKAHQPLLTISSPDAAAARSSLAAAQAARDAARKDLDRQDAMMKAHVGVEADRQAASARLAQAEAELARARAAVQFLGGGGGNTVVLSSPIDGTVLAREATVGTIAQPGGDPLIEVGDPSAIWVVADVFERDLGEVTVGAAVKVTVASQPTPIAGHVAAIGAMLSSELRTAPVTITLDHPVGGLRAGMFARAAIDGPAGQSLILPAEAVLIEDGKKTVVYVQDPSDPTLFRAREVQIGRSIDGRVPIVSGLAPGEKVVVKNALLLDGAADQLL